MESSPKYGCTIRNQKDPYQIQCVFSTDPGEKRDFSVYFNSLDGSQDLMVSCTRSERDECIVLHEGLTVTDDYITVSETFSKQAGSFVCRNGGPPLEQFPCFYSGNSVKPEATIENGSNSSLVPANLATKDNDLAVIIGAVFGVVIILQFLVIGFLLLKNYKSKQERKASKSPAETVIGDVCTANSPLLATENKAGSINPNAIDEKTNSLKGKWDQDSNLRHFADRCMPNVNDEDHKGFKDPALVMLIGDVCTVCTAPLLVDENKASSINQNAIDEKTNSLNGKGDKHYDLSHLPGGCISNKNDKDPEGFEDPALEKNNCVSVKNCVPENNNNANNKNRDCFETLSNHPGSDHGEPHECSKKIDEYTGLTSVRVCDSEKNGEALEL